MSRAGAGVADLADKLQDHACQGDAAPIWARPGSHLSSGLVREIAVWRAANGINRQDPRPTGGTQLETLPALWKQRLDRDVARATDPPAMQRATSDRQQAPHQAVTTTADARTKDPNSVRAGRPPPADSTPRSSDCGARNPWVQATRRRQDAIRLPNLALSHQAARVLASLRRAAAASPLCC